MKYDINNKTAPKMPTLGKGTECIRLLLSQASKDMHESLVPMLFPSLGAHISGTEFQYPDLSWKEPCGMMANLVADSGGNKGQLSNLVESICRKFSKHDDEELQKLVEWQRNPLGSHEPHRERERKLPRISNELRWALTGLVEENAQGGNLTLVKQEKSVGTPTGVTVTVVTDKNKGYQKRLL